MQVVERFLSIQAEGPFTGRRAFFVRLAGCNFRCKGFGVKAQIEGKATLGCDTQRATYAAHLAPKLSAKDLILELEQISPKPLVVITGGEPLLQQNDIEFQKFLEYLSAYEVQFETNGSVQIAPLNERYFMNKHFVIGFKLASSMEKNRLNLNAINSIRNCAKSLVFKPALSAQDCQLADNYEVIYRHLSDYGDLLKPRQNERCLLDKQRHLSNLWDFDLKRQLLDYGGLLKDIDESKLLDDLNSLYGAFYASKLSYIFKFILSLNPSAKPSDALAEIALLKALYPGINIYLMPVGATSSELAQNSKEVFLCAVRLGLNYSDRVHIRIFDDKEGI